LNDSEDLEAMLRRVFREELRAFEKEKKTKIFSAPNLWITLQQGLWMNITEEHRKAWLAACPDIDLHAELLKAAAYATENPPRGPKSDRTRFLTGWLRRAQARAAAERSSRAGRADVAPMKCDNAPQCSAIARILIAGKDKREHNLCIECAEAYRMAELTDWVRANGGV
jgi:hypothetical protein